MRFRTLQIFFPLFILLAGCSPTVVKSTVSKSCKNQIQGFLSDNWFYDEAGRIYRPENRFGELSKTSFAKEGCLLELNREDIITLFGKPSKEDGNHLLYYYHKICFDNPIKCPLSLMINLSDEGYFESALTVLPIRVSH